MEEEQETQEIKETAKINPKIIAIVLFGFSYGFLYALASGSDFIAPIVKDIPFVNLLLPLPPFESPMFFVMPIVGFFFIYLLVDWMNDYFQTKQGFSPIVPLLLIVLSLTAYWIAQLWYQCNNFSIAENMACSPKGTQAALEFLANNYGSRLRSSAFLLFIWGGLLGWVSRFVVKKLSK